MDIERLIAWRNAAAYELLLLERKRSAGVYACNASWAYQLDAFETYRLAVLQAEDPDSVDDCGDCGYRYEAERRHVCTSGVGR